MVNPPTIQTIRRGLQWVLIVAFLSLLWLPSFDTLFHFDKAPTPQENRAPALFPTFHPSLEGVRVYVDGLEQYYNDHFGFRKRLIRWNNHWKHELFNQSDIPNVITGRHGWLYYSGDDMIDNCLGLTQFTLSELRQWQSLLETRRDWLARRGIHYLLVIPPNKESIYPDFLPLWMVKGRPTTKLDQFMAYMKTNTSVEILDLRPVLLDARKSSLVYQLTDTHWNYHGAFVAHQELMKTLARQIPSLTPLTLADFKETCAKKIGGDLAVMLGQEQVFTEPSFPKFQPLPPLPAVIPIAAPDLIPGKKWNKFMDPLVTKNTRRNGTAIFYRDSFSGQWMPFVGQYFGKVIYLWEKNWEPGLIEREKPVVVVDEMLERFFYTADPAKLKKEDDLK